MSNQVQTDVVLIGAGIMSATLGAFLQELEPNVSIQIFERLDKIGIESSDALNNAGTGHSALCELNYTPEKADGSVDTSKALNIMEQFEVSKQFWSYLIKKGKLSNPKQFIRQVPHMSFVMGDKDVTFLRKRYDGLQKYKLFQHMEYSEEPATIEKWAPLIIKGRKSGEKIAATYSDLGTDVDFGALTRMMVQNLQDKGNAEVNTQHEVLDLKQNSDSSWNVVVKDIKANTKKTIKAKFVFIGAGGGSLKLLQKSNIPESKIFGGFPVGGQWLICNNANIAEQHNAKIYGQASVGAPPMSVPHLDTRVINGKKAILFGPFATFSTKFLKYGSNWDLFETVKLHNMFPMMKVGLSNWDLEKYLIQQLRLSAADRVEELRKFYPEAVASDWQLENAGQRVQVIKNDPEKGAVLQFGTEIVTSKDGTIGALLGASPGASTAVSVMLNLIKKCFANKYESQYLPKLNEMIPSFGLSLESNDELREAVRNNTKQTLEL
jgi:malate dehydrogenase (quinone)